MFEQWAERGLPMAPGSGDRIAVDSQDRVVIHAHERQYTLRRVWLTRQEEEGYYYGLSNSALWPLCHIVYQMPEFRKSDWEQYVDVNEKFCQAVLEEAEGGPAIVFIQDYQLGLLSRLLRNRRADLVLVQFWHIPWPNREAFRIFPWGEQLLDGLLGNDMLGFHIQYHCNNFMDTDRSRNRGQSRLRALSHLSWRTSYIYSSLSD